MNDSKKVAKLRSLLSYNKSTGVFTWKKRGIKSFDTRFAGKTAGSITREGYIMICVYGKVYSSHRLAISFSSGRMISKSVVVDHKNHLRTDNSLKNLRVCNRSENACNTFTKGRGLSSYFKGVTKCKQTGYWLSRITKNKKVNFLGRFKIQSEAAKAYDLAAKKYHGKFATLNFA